MVLRRACRSGYRAPRRAGEDRRRYEEDTRTGARRHCIRKRGVLQAALLDLVQHAVLLEKTIRESTVAEPPGGSSDPFFQEAPG